MDYEWLMMSPWPLYNHLDLLKFFFGRLFLFQIKDLTQSRLTKFSPSENIILANLENNFYSSENKILEKAKRTPKVKLTVWPKWATMVWFISCYSDLKGHIIWIIGHGPCHMVNNEYTTYSLHLLKNKWILPNYTTDG